MGLIDALVAAMSLPRLETSSWSSPKRKEKSRRPSFSNLCAAGRDTHVNLGLELTVADRDHEELERIWIWLIW